MKILHLLTALAFTCSTYISFAQKKSDFEGIIKFKIEYAEMDEAMAPYASMLPKDIVMKIKDGKSRTEQSMGMAGNTTIITDQQSKQVITLMDMMGNKFKIVSKMDENDKAADRDVEIVHLSETKTIAGYLCKKAEIRIKETDDLLTIYYTEDISGDLMPNKPAEYKGLKGFPMEYEIAQENMRMIISVTEVKKEKLNKAEFEAPADYQEVSQEELMKMFGGR